MQATNQQTADRVRRHTDDDINRLVDRESLDRLREIEHQGPLAIDRRIAELDREWDVERVLQTNASILATTGAVLGLTVNKKFLILPAVVFGFLLQHAVQGWCPPLPVFRRLGIRTRREIDRERYALKAIRGDFDRALMERQG